MIARLKFNNVYYWKHSKEEQWVKQRAVIEVLFPGFVEDYRDEVLADLDIVMMPLAEADIEYTIKPVKGALFASTLHDKIKDLERSQKLIREMIVQDGVLAQIHIPNHSLYQVNEIEVTEDACTGAIQHMLDEGWHILCVCPPNSQRRPDYIMGRWNKERSGD